VTDRLNYTGPNSVKCIGVAGIFSGVHFFFPQNVEDLFSVVALKTQDKIT